MALADVTTMMGRRTRGGGGAGARDLNREVVGFGASGSVDDVTCDEEALEAACVHALGCVVACAHREVEDSWE